MSMSVAITGASALTPIGADAELWRWLRSSDRSARSAAGSVTIPLAHLPAAVRERAGRVERLSALVLAGGGAALAGAGLDAIGESRTRIGVVLGTAFGCFLTNAAYQQRLSAGGEGAASPRLFAATVSNAAAGELAIAYGLAGPGITLSAGGASGLLALGHATDWLAAGRAEAIVAGGADALGEALLAWLASGGLVCGRSAVEAAALLVLEDGAVAARRQHPVLGFVLGHAGGFEPDPSGPRAGEALASAVRGALMAADVGPEAIELLVGAAPPHLAALEERALDAALGAHRPRTLAPKEQIGETFAAAGPLGVLAALVAAPAGAVVLVLDVCTSGHVAALVARAGDARLA
jgi:3-oxoacyl-[acyl-carrier-protein] synthase II